MEPCLPIPFDPEILVDIVEKSKDFCLMHGEQQPNFAKNVFENIS
jgi:hypothetical protein